MVCKQKLYTCHKYILYCIVYCIVLYTAVGQREVQQDPPELSGVAVLGSVRPDNVLKTTVRRRQLLDRVLWHCSVATPGESAAWQGLHSVRYFRQVDLLPGLPIQEVDEGERA